LRAPSIAAELLPGPRSGRGFRRIVARLEGQNLERRLGLTYFLREVHLAMQTVRIALHEGKSSSKSS